MKTLILCNSDVLSAPLIHHLNSTQELLAVGFPETNAERLKNTFVSLNLEGDRMKVFNRSNFNEELQKWIKQFEPELLLTLTFPWVLPTDVLQSIKFGAYNFHFGTLPKYRGADPIFWQIKNGEEFVSLTVHQISSQKDKGPILQENKIPIIPGVNYGYLAETYAAQTINSFNEVKNRIREKAELKEQEVEESKFENAPSYLDLKINWELQGADEIENLVNAANPKYNGAITSINNIPIHLLEVSPADYQVDAQKDIVPGEVVYADLIYGLVVSTCDSKFLKISVALLSGGYYSGSKLFVMGFKVGNRFI